MTGEAHSERAIARSLPGRQTGEDSTSHGRSFSALPTDRG